MYLVRVIQVWSWVTILSNWNYDLFISRDFPHFYSCIDLISKSLFIRKKVKKNYVNGFIQASHKKNRFFPVKKLFKVDNVLWKNSGYSIIFTQIFRSISLFWLPHLRPDSRGELDGLPRRHLSSVWGGHPASHGQQHQQIRLERRAEGVLSF